MSLRRYPFNDVGGPGRHALPDDIDIPHLGAYQPFVGLYINALQGGHLPMNGGLDDGGTRGAVFLALERRPVS